MGIAGGPDKCAMLVDELGFDAAIDYRAEDVRKALRREAPDGASTSTSTMSEGTSSTRP